MFSVSEESSERSDQASCWEIHGITTAGPFQVAEEATAVRQENRRGGQHRPPALALATPLALDEDGHFMYGIPGVLITGRGTDLVYKEARTFPGETFSLTSPNPALAAENAKIDSLMKATSIALDTC
jgi:hypothetical protein